MNFIKKQTISTWLSLVTLILAIVSVALFAAGNADPAADGLFGAGDTSSLMACTVISIVLLAAVIVLSQFNFNGLIGWIIEWVVWAAKIVACALLAAAIIYFLSLRVQGLANLYFSDENIQATMQTDENLAAASSAITGIIMYAVTTVIAVVAAFFRPYKKVKKTAEAAA